LDQVMVYWNQQWSYIPLVVGVWAAYILVPFFYVLTLYFPGRYKFTKFKNIFFGVAIWGLINFVIFTLNWYSACTIPVTLGMKAPIIIPTYNRDKYLRETLDGLTKNPTFRDHPLIISQDGNDFAVYNTCEWYSTHYSNIYHIQHYRDPITMLPFHVSFVEASASRNFFYLLDTAFNRFPDCKSVIVLEEDMWPSLDLLQYAEWAEKNILSIPRFGFVFCQPYDPYNFSINVEENLYKIRDRFMWTSRGWILSRKCWEQVVRECWTLFGNYDLHLFRNVVPYFQFATAEPLLARTKHLGAKGISFKHSEEEHQKSDLSVVTPQTNMTEINHPVEWV